MIENTTNTGAGSVLYDTLGPLDGYPCTTGPKKGGNCAVDYDFRFPGPLTLRYALGGSRNIPAMKAMLTAGVDKTRETSKKLMQSPGTPEGEARGDYNCYRDDALTKESQCYTAAAIGDGAYLKLDEHVHGFASLSRNGLNIPQTYILKIEDSSNKVIDEWKASKGVQAIRPDTAYIVSDMVSDPKASYLGNKTHNYKGWKFGFKTGTTNDSKDGWMMGMSTQYAAGTWVGYHNRQKELGGFMETMTQPIVAGFMQRAHEGIKPVDRPKPSGVQTLPAFVVRNHVGVGSVEPSPTTDLFPSWYKRSTGNTKQTIDIVSNKLATDCTPARAKQDATNAAANQFSSDKFVGGANRAASTTTEKDDVHRCEDAKPSITLTTPATCDGSCTFTATATQGTHPISSDRFKGTVNFKVDGQVIQSIGIGSSPSTVSTNYTVAVSPGPHTVSAEVIDSVLYDNVDSRSVNFTSASVSAISVTKAQISGPKTKFQWSGGNGSASIYNANTDALICGGGGSCEVNVALAPLGTPVYARDTSGARSSNVAVSN
jgi:membrane peptidoglycan carboxypeptidase